MQSLQMMMSTITVNAEYYGRAPDVPGSCIGEAIARETVEITVEKKGHGIRIIYARIQRQMV
jgi:hypothetical protein